MTGSSDQAVSHNPASDNLAFDDSRANDPDPSQSGASMREFVRQVQRLAALESESEAEALVRATLRKLGGRISSGQAQDLTRALPTELSGEATSQHVSHARAVDKNELIDQISGEIHSTDAENVEKQVAMVLSTLRRWAPDGAIDDTVAQLPPQLAALFE